MFLILKMNEGKAIVEIEIQSIEPFIEVLKGATIIDDEGELWTIDPEAKLYYDLNLFSIDCKRLES